MKSYKAEELFDENGRLLPELADLAPKGRSADGLQSRTRTAESCCSDLRMPDFCDHAVARALAGRRRRPGHARARTVPARRREAQPGASATSASSGRTRRSRTCSERGVRGHRSTVGREGRSANDEFLAPSGLVLDSMLSEHQCEGWLEGYLLTGRHGLFNSYEAFIRIVDSMFSQHAKWLKVTPGAALAPEDLQSLNYLLASHVWQQDHNGFTHQDPGFLDHVINKKADVVRVYLPPDANCLLVGLRPLPAQPELRERGGGGQARASAVADHGRRQVVHCTKGIGIWQWASNDQRRRAGRRDGLLRRHADPGGVGGGVDPPRAPARPEDPRR